MKDYIAAREDRSKPQIIRTCARCGGGIGARGKFCAPCSDLNNQERQARNAKRRAAKRGN
jgi:hypothetical protein